MDDREAGIFTRQAVTFGAAVHVAGHSIDSTYPTSLKSRYMHYVYVLESETSGRWYIGFTGDLRARLTKHNQHGNVSTAHRGPWRLIYYEAYLMREDALGREKFLKSGSGWKFLKKQMRRHIASQATKYIRTSSNTHRQISE